MEQGTVVKIHSNYYYVLCQQELIECFLRGKFKRDKKQVFVGDIVRFQTTGEKTGVIEAIEERKSLLKRPPVANLDQVIIVFSVKSPDPNWLLFDRFLVLAEQAELKVIICLQKIDLQASETVLDMAECYRKIGYQVISCSAQDNLGIEELRACLKDRLSVFAGPSGVGKSALLNCLQPGLQLKTGVLSEKIQRGKHTTRHVELMNLAFGGLVVDAPGFSSLEFSSMERAALVACFPELMRYGEECRYQPCFHQHEQDCAVKDAVACGEISNHRYENYTKMLLEIKEKKGDRWK